jgi:uncharacterized protein (DUF983 family)
MGLLNNIFRGVCPRCQQGTIFQGFFKMYPECPVCHLKLEREPGYFLGAMYISYFLSIVCMGIIFLLVHTFSRQRFIVALSETALFYLPLVPFVFRFSRILWIYLDRTIDP